jgi:5'-nucleotidase
MRVLVTNDDGVDSAGLHALAVMLRQQGFDVVVAAPAADASGSSAAIIGSEKDGRIRMERKEFSGFTAYAVAATPAFITLIATRGAFGDPPDLVCSGINLGANVGRAVIHSGTVGAVLTGVTYGCPGLAVSLDVRDAVKSPHWTDAAAIAGQLVPLLLKESEPAAWSLNVPDRPRDEVLGVREAPLAAFGAVQTQFEAGDGYLRMTIAERESALETGTDAALLADGYAPVTALKAVTGASISSELPN